MATRYYIMQDGARLYKSSVKAIETAARNLANATGLPVPVHLDAGLGGRARVRVQRAGQVFARNPVMQGHDFTGEEWKVTATSPHGSRVSVYANSKREAADEVRVLRSGGYRGVQSFRIAGPVEGRARVMKRNPSSRNPFGPLPSGQQSQWSAAEHQRAANYYFYEMQGATLENMGPNYKPYYSGMKAAFEDHTRKAKALRKR